MKKICTQKNIPPQKKRRKKVRGKKGTRTKSVPKKKRNRKKTIGKKTEKLEPKQHDMELAIKSSLVFSTHFENLKTQVLAKFPFVKFKINFYWDLL